MNIPFFIALLFIVGCSDSNDPAPPDNNSPTLPPSSGRDYTDENLLKSLNVRVSTSYKNGRRTKGSGVCLGSDIVVTNYHVVYPRDNGGIQAIQVRNVNGRESDVQSMNVEKVENDLVILKLGEAICEQTVPSNDVRTLTKTGDSVIHVGNPLDQDWVVRRGNMETPVRLKDLSDSILKRINWITAQTSVARTTIDTTHGSSGGGVYSKEGLTGILFAGGEFDEQKEVLVISADYLRGMDLNADHIPLQMIVNGDLDQDYLGVQVNHSTTNMLLGPRFNLNYPDNTDSLLRDNVLTRELFEKALQSKIRMMQFFNVSPNQTAVIIMSDRNWDGRIDLFVMVMIEGIFKDLPESLSFDRIRDGSFLVVSDENFDFMADLAGFRENW